MVFDWAAKSVCQKVVLMVIQWVMASVDKTVVCWETQLAANSVA